MTGKHFFFILALIFIGIGIRSVIKQEASWSTKVPESEKRFVTDRDRKTQYFTGPIAVIIGIIEIAVGIGLLFSAIKME